MNIKRLNEELEDLIITFQLNEMAIYYGTNHGTVKDVQQGLKKLLQTKEGMVTVKQNLSVQKTVTQQEINNKLFKPIQKGIPVKRTYPIVLVWGERDKIKQRKKLEGHGLSHILQGHGNEVYDVFNRLQKELNRGITCKEDKYGNYMFKVANYRFIFTLVDNDDGTPKYAVLLTAFKK